MDTFSRGLGIIFIVPHSCSVSAVDVIGPQDAPAEPELDCEVGNLRVMGEELLQTT